MNHNINWNLDHLKKLDCFKYNNTHGKKYVFPFAHPSFSLWSSNRIKILLIKSLPTGGHLLVYLVKKRKKERKEKTKCKLNKQRCMRIVSKSHCQEILVLFYSKMSNNVSGREQWRIFAIESQQRHKSFIVAAPPSL